MVDERTAGIRIEHTARSVTSIVGGHVSHIDDGDRIQFHFRSQFGSGMRVLIGTNQVSDATFQRVGALVKQMVPPSDSSEAVPDDSDDPQYFVYNARGFPPVALWHDATANAMDTARATVLPSLVERVQSSGLVSAATVGIAARSVLYLYRLGLTAFAEETDCEITVTARTPDGSASGWGGVASRDWIQLDPAVAAQRAIELAERSRHCVALEPGRRVAILSPAAVAQLVVQMAYAFNAIPTNTRGVQGTPFSVVNYDAHGRHNKVGRRVFDARIMMRSDPADPLGGYPPFFESGGVEYVLHGYPTPAITWIDHGVLTNLAYGVGSGVGLGLVPNDIPRSVRLAPAPGTSTATLDEMISHCQEGIYVNRFSEVALLDFQTGLMTGVTRDGCFLVKNGKIVKPIKNFRFVDSPFFNFNNLEMIGMPERVAFGYNVPPRNGEFQRWPRLPVIVPPLMIRDFNFSALSDAI